jgi:hypothetical protein
MKQNNKKWINMAKLLKKGKGSKKLNELDNPEFQQFCMYWANNEMNSDKNINIFFTTLKDENERRGYPCGG